MSSYSHLSFLSGGHFWTSEQGRGIQTEQRPQQSKVRRQRCKHGVSAEQLEFVGHSTTEEKAT